MSFEEFIEKVIVLDEGIYELDTHQKQTYKPRLYVQWSTGGVSGGSCWDDGTTDNHYSYVSTDEPKDLTLLDKILEEIKPDISFLQYRNLCNELIKYDSTTEYEYYGNSTNYQSKEVDLRQLYDYLVDQGWINE